MDFDTPRSEMGLLADEITEQIAIWEAYGEQSGTSLPSVAFDIRTPVLTVHNPDNVLQAREKIINSAFKLLQLTAGPSKFASIAISYSQTLMALKWLFHYKIFDHVPDEPIEYYELSLSANVSDLELKRMLKLVMASYIFTELEDETVQHNIVSRAFAHDENMRRGIPFFCDVVMPAAAKMQDASSRWPDSEDSDETARNIALSNDLTFPQYLTDCNQTEGYSRLMKLFGSEPSQQNAFSANVIQGFDWASLPRDALVVELESCSPCCWELAELFPHLQFEVQGPQDKLTILKDFVRMRNPGLLARINFFPHDFRDEQITHSARVYLLSGTLQNLPEEDIKEILQNLERVMAPASTVLIVDSVLPEADEEPLAVHRESRCRDMTTRQLHNAGARSLREWEELMLNVVHLGVKDTKRVPGSVLTTLVVGL